MTSATQVLKQVAIKRFQDIPGPKSLPLIGTLHTYFPIIGEFNLQRLHHNGMLKYRRYGKLVKEEIIPGVNLLFLYDPIDIESMFRLEGRYPFRRSHTALEKFRIDSPELHKSGGLLPTNGIEWANMRGQYQQSLSRESVQGFITQTDEIVLEFLQRVNDPLEQPMLTKDFLPYLMSVYAEILGSNLFSIRFGALTSVGKPESLGEKLIKAGERVNSLTLRTDNGPRLWRYFDTPLYKSLKTNMGYLEKVSREIVEARVKSAGLTPSKPCLLTTWMEDFRGTNDIRDIVTMSADMILAGIDTTAFTSSFILYHLAHNDHQQQLLFDELKTLLPTWDTPMTSEILAKAGFLKRVVKESLRLNPISIGVGRQLTQDGIIRGHHIPQGTVIVTQNQVTCRLEEYFEKPNEFLPERWDAKNRGKRPHPYTMIPFGHGPRACIGRRLAEQNIYIVIAKLLRRFHVKWQGSRKLDCLSQTINKPDSPLKFVFTPRIE